MFQGPRAWWLFALILVLNLTLTLRNLDSDPPAPLTGGPSPNEGLFVQNARNLVLAGDAHLDEWNNRLLHPVGTLLTEAAFRWFGVSLAVARSVSVLLSLLSLLLFFDLLRRGSGSPAAVLGTLFLATNPLFVTYSRQAGPAALTIFLFLLTIYLWDLGSRHRGVLVVAGACLTLGAVIENGPQSAFFLVAAGLALLLIRMQAWKMPWAAATRSRRELFFWSALLCGALWLGLVLIPRFDQFIRLTAVPLGVPRWGHVPQNLFMAPFTLWGFIRWMPALCLLVSIYYLFFARTLFVPIARHLPFSETRVWFFAWLVTAPIFVALQSERPLSLMVVMVPPICMAGAEALVALLALRQVRKPRVDILVALGLLSLGCWFVLQGGVHWIVNRWYMRIPPEFFRHQFRYEFLLVVLLATPLAVLLAHLWLRWKKFQFDLSPHAVSWAFALSLLAVLAAWVAPFQWSMAPRFTIRDVGRELRKLPEDAVVAGTWAPLLSLESSRRGLVLWPTINSQDPIRRFGVTHLLLQRGSSEDLNHSRVLPRIDPPIEPRLTRLGELALGRGVLDLYRVETPAP